MDGWEPKRVLGTGERSPKMLATHWQKFFPFAKNSRYIFLSELLVLEPQVLLLAAPPPPIRF